MQLQSQRNVARSGFTLLELLVVMGIILTLLTITALAVNLNNDRDRVRQGARQVQSFLHGARDRAIRTGEEVGVRFFFGQPGENADATATQLAARQISNMAYIQRSGTWPVAGAPQEIIESVATEDLNSDSDTNDAGELSIFTTDTGWWSLKRRGWLVDGMRVRIPDSPNGQWYQIDTSQIDTTTGPAATTEIRLLTANNGKVTRGMSYSIELPWMMLPEEPSILPENVVIDLDASRVPAAWRPVAAGDLYQDFIDVIFSPRGTVTDEAAAAGLLHFYVCDAEDSRFLKEQYADFLGGFDSFNDEINTAGIEFVPMDQLNTTVSPWVGVEYNVQPRRIVTLIPQTGSVSVHDLNAYVDPSLDQFAGNDPADNSPKNGIADDPYRFAETGNTSQ